jgi:hypothetical protein
MFLAASSIEKKNSFFVCKDSRSLPLSDDKSAKRWRRSKVPFNHIAWPDFGLHIVHHVQINLYGAPMMVALGKKENKRKWQKVPAVGEKSRKIAKTLLCLHIE